MTASQVYMIQERCWFSQIDFFVENFPHRINVLFLSSQFHVIHIHSPFSRCTNKHSQLGTFSQPYFKFPFAQKSCQRMTVQISAQEERLDLPYWTICVFWRTQNPRCRSPHKRAWMVTMSRRKRMVAHNITDTPVFLAVMVRRRPFFQEDPLIMFITLVLYIMPPNKVEVGPRFVVAALISQADAKSSIIRAQAQHVARNEQNTMKPYFSVPIGFGRFKEPKNVSPVARNRSRCPQWCWARRHRQGALGKDFFDGTDIVDVVASPCSTLEVTSNHVQIVFEHHCTNCKDELLSYATFLSVNVSNV